MTQLEAPGIDEAGAVIDAHLHFVDFLQDSDGMPALLQRMDEAGVAKAVIFGMPVVKKWDAYDPVEPHYYLDDNARCYYYAYTDALVASACASLAPDQRARFAPLACGFNPTDRHAIRHLERVFGDYPGWRGVGEILLRHDDLTNLTSEETARANHPAMTPVYAFCAERGLPILLHQNSTSVGTHDRYVYLHELEEVLDRHRDLTVVWGHCGLSRRVFHERYHEMIDRLLRAYPRLAVDASWVGYDDVMCAGGALRPEWVGLIERFADRVMIGSDVVGHFGDLPRAMRRYGALLRALSPGAREAVARGTAERLFFAPRPA